MNNPYERAIGTQYGVYKLKVTKDVQIFYSINARQKEIGAIINLGGKDTNCIQINVPYEGTVGKLLRIQAGIKNECSIDNKEQRGEKLIHMVELGITIAKEINANLETLELEDDASFDCKLPDGRTIAMSSTDHDIAFYQQSYYEKRYGAILINSELRKDYNKDIKKFEDPSRKPERFDFKNNDIEKELLPLYNSSKNWKEFFDKINEKYDKKKCTVVALWLKSALLHIFNDRIYSGMKWKIDIKNIPKITYEERVLLKSGGRTRKKEKYIKRTMMPELLEMDWKGYFSKKT